MGYPKILFVILIILVWFVPAHSLVLRSGRDVVINADEIIDDDLIAFARTVKIDGRVNGDVFAFAQEVTIENIVNGSIYTGGAEINVNTKSCRSIWAFCGSLNTSANIGNNLLFFGGHLKTDNSNIIQKDLLAFGGDIQIRGEVKGRVKGNMGRLNLNGKIGSADINAEEVKIGPEAMVLENLSISSEKEPLIDSSAKLLGKTEFKKIEEKTERHRKTVGLSGFFKILFFISKLIIGIILIALFKPYFRKTSEYFKEHTWKSLGFGFLTIIVIPVVTVLTLISIIGIPVSIFGIFVFLTLVYVSSIIFATGFGEWLIKLFKKDSVVSPFPAFILGLIIISILSLIPYLGLFIRLAILFFGTGMLIILLHKLWQNSMAMEEK